MNTPSPQSAGGDYSIGSSADPVTGLTRAVTLSAGQIYTDLDAGLVPVEPTVIATAAIGDLVWLDTDRDGIKDSNETGLAGIRVDLIGAGSDGRFGTSDDIVLATTASDSSGRYVFTNLAAGQYKVRFQANGLAFSPATQGTDRAADSSPGADGITGVITLAAGHTDTTIDAGLYGARIGNRVWLDSNQNGIQDRNETAGLASVRVDLLGAGDDGRFGTADDIRLTTASDSCGYYAFMDLRAGQYQVTFSAPNGMRFSLTAAGTNSAADSNAGANGVTGTISLAAGQANDTIDAGLYVPCFVAGYGGLTPGFWSSHVAAWDGVKDTKYNNLVREGTLSVPDVIHALPNHGKSGPGGAVGVLLGDINRNGVTDAGENTLFVSREAARQLISSSASANDTRQVLIRHALAAQLNIDNGEKTPGLLTVGTDIMTVAVAWLKGQSLNSAHAPSFVYSDGSSGKVDFVGASGVMDAGIRGAIDYNAKTASLTSAQLTSNKMAWQAEISLGLSPTDFRVSGEDIKNALQAMNQNQLVTSKDGTLVGWSNGYAVVDIRANDAAGVWTVLKDAGVIS